MDFDEALNRARQQADQQETWKRQSQETAKRYRQRISEAAVQAAAALVPYGNELFVLIEPSSRFFTYKPFWDGDNTRFRVVSRQACWTVSRQEGSNPLLLLADGSVGTFHQEPANLQIADLAYSWRRRFHEYISQSQLREVLEESDAELVLGPGEQKVKDLERQLAETVVRYERSGISRAELPE